MAMYPGVSLITLGVADVARARGFYERLGWRCSQGASTPEVAFFTLNNVALALFGRADMLEDAGMDPKGAQAGAPSIMLAQNHPAPQAVDRAMSAAVAAGGSLVKQAQATSWGGYHGMVADPDGHVWELAWNPGFPLSASGEIELPP
jgi:predicted lactoylglutathione lyase